MNDSEASERQEKVDVEWDDIALPTTQPFDIIYAVDKRTDEG